VQLRSLNDATHEAGNWDPAAAARNARIADEDLTTIAYLGEFNSGASAISIPIINEANILQISPINEYPGLTEREGLHGPGEPDKYYPTGNRTFGRLIPTDVAEARALASSMAQQHVRRLILVDDGGFYGHGFSILLRRQLAHGSIRTVGLMGFHRGRAEAKAIARRLRTARADAAFFGGMPSDRPELVWRVLHRADPSIKLFGPGALADHTFTNRLRGALARATFLTFTTLPEEAYPPNARPFFAAFRKRYGRAPIGLAICGYEAMRLVLDDIAAARQTIAPATDVGTLRAAVLAQFFATRDRASPLGTYSITPTGDITPGRVGAYRVTARGRLHFDHVIAVPGP
jgi:branched-chain amino acid transport system substrate-binding protein